LKFTLVFDSDCGPCTHFKNVVSFLDTSGRIRYMGLSEADSSGLLDAVPVDLRCRSFHLISPSGEVKSGPSAFPDLARLLPGGGLPAKLLEQSVPASWVGARIYLVLSRLHDAGACTRPRLGVNIDINIDKQAEKAVGAGSRSFLAHSQPL